MCVFIESNTYRFLIYYLFEYGHGHILHVPCLSDWAFWQQMKCENKQQMLLLFYSIRRMDTIPNKQKKKKTMNNYIKNIMCNIFKKLNGIDHECHRYACRANFSLIIIFFSKKRITEKNHFQLSVWNWRAFDRLVESYLHDIIFFICMNQHLQT